MSTLRMASKRTVFVPFVIHATLFGDFFSVTSQQEIDETATQHNVKKHASSPSCSVLMSFRKCDSVVLAKCIEIAN